jgi:autotransporter-associated beta strand protein
LKKSTATLVLEGVNTYTGDTLIADGTLILKGSLTSNISTSTDTLVIEGNASTTRKVTVTNGGTFEIALQPPQLDQLSVGGTVTLGGTLDFIAAPGLTLGSDFIILNKTSAGAIVGIFTTLPQGHVWQSQGYWWSISYTGGDGNDVVLHLLTPIEQWRYTNFNSMFSSGLGLDTADSDGDNASNLLEYATAMNPAANDQVPTSAAKAGNALEFIYTKNKASTDVTYTVEWSDDLVNWDNAGVTSSVLTDGATTQQIKALVPSGVDRRFVHLKVTRP